MAILYNLVASSLAAWELSDVIKLTTRGRAPLLGNNPFVCFVSFSKGKETQADLEFLMDWVAVAKFLISLCLVGSILSHEPVVRVFFSVSCTAAMAFYFMSMRTSLRKVETLKELASGVALRLDIIMGVLFVFFATGAALEIHEAVSA